MHITGWTTESLLDWGQFLKLAVSGLLMTCIDWWSFETSSFLAGTGEPHLNFTMTFGWTRGNSGRAFVFKLHLNFSNEKESRQADQNHNSPSKCSVSYFVAA